MLAAAEHSMEVRRWKTLLPVVDETLKQITGKRLTGFRQWNNWYTSKDGKKWRVANGESK